MVASLETHKIGFCSVSKTTAPLTIYCQLLVLWDATLDSAGLMKFLPFTWLIRIPVDPAAGAEKLPRKWSMQVGKTNLLSFLTIISHYFKSAQNYNLFKPMKT